MSSATFAILLRFFLLLAAQFFLFDNVDLLGYANPFIYLIFIFLYPVNANRSLLLIWSFALGLIIDTYSDTGGAHAAACTTLAFLRPRLLALVYGESYTTKNLKVTRNGYDKLFLFMALGVLVHHLVLFMLIVFDISHMLYVLELLAVNGLLTLLISWLLLIFFKRKGRV